MPTAFIRTNKTHGRDVTRAGGSDWHKAESYCNVINNCPMTGASS
jgi:hypothetical protein